MCGAYTKSRSPKVLENVVKSVYTKITMKKVLKEALKAWEEYDRTGILPEKLAKKKRKCAKRSAKSRQKAQK